MKKTKIFLFTLMAFFVVGFAVNVNAEGNVAKVGDTEYASLQAAIDAATEGQTVVLLQDVEENPTIDGKNIVLDLGGNTLTVSDYGIDTYTSTVVVKNGTIFSDGGFGIYLNSGNNFTLDSTAKITGLGTGILSDLYPKDATDINTVIINGDIDLDGTGITLDNESTLIVNEGAKIVATDGILIAEETEKSDDGLIHNHTNASNVTINGYVSGTNVAATINGNITSDVKSPTITVGSKAEMVAVGEETVALYLAGYGKTTVDDGAKLSGDAAAVEIRAGELTINGGTFTADYDGEVTVIPNGNGSTTTGAALAIAQHTTKSPINVVINGGTFNGVATIYESNPQENSAEDIAKVSVKVTGGEFNATSDQSVYSEDLTGFISGGTYNVSPDNVYVADGYKIFNVAGIYEVHTKDISSATVTGIKTQTYNGKAQRQDSLVVKLAGNTLVKDVDYQVLYNKLTNAGTITMTIKGIGDYEGKIVKTFVRKKAKNPLTIKAYNKTVSYSKVKKSAQVVKPIYVSKKVGTLTYTKMSGSSTKLLLNKTTGKVTVKKGTKKGKYKIKIKVFASGSSNYFSNYGIKTIYVTVK